MPLLLLGVGIALASALSAQTSPAATRDVSIAVPPSVREAAGFDPDASAGLFVGVRGFDDPELKEVPFAVDDAVDLAHLFAFDLRLIPAAKTVLSLSGEPQKKESQARLRALLSAGAVREIARQSEIYEQLDRQARATRPRGLFVAAFATHGFHDPGGDFLLASHSRLRFIERTGVAVSEVLDVASKASSERRLVLLDACRERFSSERGSAGAAMNPTFAQAIAEAKGQAVLAGATAGGYAYDDFERRNGVFTAAVIDALRGAAPSDARGLITVASLAEYVNDRVLAWVRANRPDLVGRTRGIEKRVDVVTEKMPLALDAERFQKVEAYRQRREAALDGLSIHRRRGGGLTGAMADEIEQVLAGDLPNEVQLELLERVEALDGTALRNEHLVLYFKSYKAGLDGGPSTTTSTRSTRPTDVAPPVAKQGDRFMDPVLGIEFVYIEPGDFMMGSPADEEGRGSDENQHEVKLTRGFWMSTKEITQSQFGKFVKAEGYKTTAEEKGTSRVLEGFQWNDKMGISWRDSGGQNRPVVHVSWLDAVAFSEWLSGQIEETIRLPTESEWEYAARAGSEGAIYGSDLGKIAWCSGNSKQRSHNVGTKDPNDWGLYDMLGNVWEWTNDWYESEYPIGSVTDPTGPAEGSSRVFRGGAWSYDAAYCRAADRGGFAPGYRYVSVGFRLVGTYP